MAAVEIREVRTATDVEAFVRLPERLYADDPNFIAPLRIMERDRLDRKKNPFFQRSEAAFFLASRNGTDIGRISAQEYRDHIEHYHDATGHFGFLAAEDDPVAVSTLLETAEAWVRARGLRRITGPYSLRIHDEAGLLVDGFDSPPTMMMGHNPPYLVGLVEACGYTKVRDLLTYRIDMSRALPERYAKLAKRRPGFPGLVIRPINMRHYRQEAERVFDIFNDAWQDNWGFVPMRREEIDSIAKEMRMIINPKWALIAELDGRPVGMIVGIADLNDVIRDIGPAPSPLGWLRILYRLKFGRLAVGRVIMGGITKEFRKTPRSNFLFGQLLVRLMEASRGRVYGTAEMGWMLEDNIDVLSWMRSIGARQAKTYRVYEKLLTAGP